MAENEERRSLICAQRIRELRKAHKLNQETFGQKIGVSLNAVSDWERKGVIPKPQFLDAMARLFNVSVDYILGMTTIPERAGNSEHEDVPRLQTGMVIDDLVQRLASRNPDIVLLFTEKFSDDELEIIYPTLLTVLNLRAKERKLEAARKTVPIADGPAPGVANGQDHVG